MFYTDTDPTWRALLIKKGKCTALAPNTVVGQHPSWADGINDRGDISGSYWEGNQVYAPGPVHGFLLDKSAALTVLDFPTADATTGFKINASGTVVGRWDINDSSGNVLSVHGFTWKNGNFSDFLFPGAANAFVQGINSRGDLVGYWDPDWYGIVWHGYLYSNRVQSTIDFPGAQTTITTDINDQGDIVGQFNDAGFVTHGFLKVGSKLIQIDYPAAAITGLEGMNNRGQMVGWYYDSDFNVHGMLVEPLK
jgi:hypothetical protein